MPPRMAEEEVVKKKKRRGEEEEEEEPGTGREPGTEILDRLHEQCWNSE